MAKRSVTVRSLIGPGMTNQNSFVDVRPAYRFVDGAKINWPDKKTFKIENGLATIPSMEDTYSGASVVWEFTFRNLDSLNQPIGEGPRTELVTFDGTSGPIVEYVTMQQMSLAPLPSFAESAASRAEAARDEAEAAAAAAAAVGATSDAQMASNVTGGPLTSAALAAGFAPRLRAAFSAATTYTLAASDVGKVVEMTNTATAVVVVPTDTVASIAVGSEITILRRGAGQVRVQPQFENLALNPNVETDASAWSARNGTASRVAAITLGGAFVYRAVSTGSGGFGVFAGGTLAALGLAPGDVINIAMMVSSSLNTSITARFNRSGVQVGSTSVGGAGSSGTITVSNVTVPAGATELVIFTNATATAAGQTIDHDSLRIYRAPGLSTYFDGNSTDGQWVGAANVSQSQAPRVDGTQTSLPQYKAVLLRKVAANRWVLAEALAQGVLTDTSVLVNDRDNGQSGIVAPSTPYATLGTMNLVSNTCYFQRFVPTRLMGIVKIAFEVTTASGSSDPVDVAIYTAGGTRLVASGSVTPGVNTAGLKTVPITQTVLTAGTVYYAAITATSTVQLRAVSVVSAAFGTTMGRAESMFVASSFPTPSPASGLGPGTTEPILFLLEV